ncbi:MAG: cation:dicarboxylase symporter family transporter, partial [Gemmatimonadales bacterium]
MKLHTRISIGLLAGAIVGLAANVLAERGLTMLASAVGLLEPIGTIFIRAITMIVIPLVVASLVVGIASLGDLRALGRIGTRTFLLYMSTTAIAVTIGIVLSNLVKPGSRMPEEAKLALLTQFGGEAEGRIALADRAPGLVDMLVNMVPANPIAAAAGGDMLPLIVFTLVFGAAASQLREDRKQIFVRFFEAINDVAMTVIHWIMKTAPYAVFALIAAVTARFGLDILKSLMVYALVVVAGLLLHAFGTYALLVRFLAKLNPLVFYRRIREV